MTPASSIPIGRGAGDVPAPGRIVWPTLEEAAAAYTSPAAFAEWLAARGLTMPVLAGLLSEAEARMDALDSRWTPDADAPETTPSPESE